MKHTVILLAYLILVAPVQAAQVKIMHSVSSPYMKPGGHQLSKVATLSAMPRQPAAGPSLEANSQNISVGGDFRGVKNQTPDPSESVKKPQEGPKKSQEKALENEIQPHKKYLTQQGVETRETVMSIAEQVYSGQDLIAFDNLIKAESGYRYDAVNGSGAGGLGQALPWSKMGCQLTREDIPCQVNWMMGYISRRYGSPSKAWAFWLSRVPINGKDVGNWY